MNRKVKNVLIFSAGVFGGLVISGVSITKALIESKTFGPAIKNALTDKIGESLDKFLYGTKPTYSYNRYYSRRSNSRVSYKNYSESKAKRNRENMFDNVIFETQYDADDTLTNMKNILDEYGYVTVADLYAMCGVVTNYKDNKKGWCSLDDAYVIKVRSGWMIRFKTPTEIE